MNKIAHHTILLIDDDEDDQYIFTEALKDIFPNMQCLFAKTGNEGLEILQENNFPSVIFLDINMPVMNGFEFLSMIKKKELYKNIPIVMLTTSGSLTDIKRSRTLGAVQFLTKTSDFKSLKEKLRTVLLADLSFSNI